MRKIECLITEDISQVVDKLRELKHQTRAEFNRQAILDRVDKELSNNNLQDKIKEFLGE